MTEKDAVAVWDGWMSNEHFDANRSVPDREMLESLIGCDRSAKAGDLERLELEPGLTIGEAAEELISRYYP